MSSCVTEQYIPLSAKRAQTLRTQGLPRVKSVIWVLWYMKYNKSDVPFLRPFLGQVVQRDPGTGTFHMRFPGEDTTVYECKYDNTEELLPVHVDGADEYLPVKGRRYAWVPAEKKCKLRVTFRDDHSDGVNIDLCFAIRPTQPLSHIVHHCASAYAVQYADLIVYTKAQNHDEFVLLTKDPRSVSLQTAPEIVQLKIYHPITV